MTHYQQLSTTKYYHDSVRQEIKQIRRQKNRDAIRAFGQFIFVLVVFAGTFYAVQQLPNWMPVVTAFLEDRGVTEAVQTWIG